MKLSLNDKMTGLADMVRSVSGATDKLGIDDMKATISHLGNFQDLGWLVAGQDANDSTNSGFYNVGNISAIKNIPENYGVLLVFAPSFGQNYILQIYGSVSGHIYTRVRNIAKIGWSDWTKLGG